MFLDTIASFRVDENNKLKSVVLRFVVDELNTALTIATLELDKDGDKVFTSDDKEKVAKTVIKGFSHYNFYTYLQTNNKEVALKVPQKPDINLVSGKLVIAMEIYLNEPFSVSGKTFTLKLYDPTYFTEVTVVEAPKIVGDNTGCRVTFQKTRLDDKTSQLQVSLFQLSREETPEIENVGALFADETRLECA